MAIWEKIYSLIGWENQPSTKTPISASNLNKMDVAINELDDRVLELGGSVENILGNFATEYNSELTYAVGDYVIYDGLLYKCVTAITTAESFDSTKWSKTDCGKEFNILNNNLDKIPVYRSEVHVKEGITIPANGIVEVLFTFDKPFTELPIVAPDVRGSGTNTTTQLWKVYTDSCSVKIYNNTSVEQTNRGIRVIAMGY